MADNHDPLAALQKLLADQKNTVNHDDQVNDSVASETPDVSSEDASSISKAVNPGPSAEEIALLQKQKEEEDNLKIKKQLEMMQTELKETPQYQARINQKQASEADYEKKRLEERSKRIFQLKHLENS
jgi:hypothetical protein